jgi:hypothetical protein
VNPAGADLDALFTLAAHRVFDVGDGFEVQTKDLVHSDNIFWSSLAESRTCVKVRRECLAAPADLFKELSISVQLFFSAAVRA